MDSDMSARASSSRPPSSPATAETVFLSIALFTAFSGSPVRTAASVGVNRVSCVCMVLSIIILYVENIYHNDGKINGLRGFRFDHYANVAGCARMASTLKDLQFSVERCWVFCGDGIAPRLAAIDATPRPRGAAAEDERQRRRPAR